MDVNQNKGALKEDVKRKILDTLVAAGIISHDHSGQVTVSFENGHLRYIELRKTIK